MLLCYTKTFPTYISLYVRLISYFLYIFAIMQTINSFVSSFDQFKANPTLRFKGKPYSGSLFLGIFSFILLGLFSALLYYRIREARNLSTNLMSYSQFQEKPLSGQVENFMFGLKFFTQGELTLDPIQYEKYFSIYVKYYSVQEQKDKLVMFKPCKVEQWTRLGVNYSQIFDNQGLKTGFCPPFLNGLNVTAPDINQNHYMELILTQCDPALTKNCAERSKIAQLISPNGSYFYMRMLVLMLVDRAVVSDQYPKLSFMSNVLTKTPFSQDNSSYLNAMSYVNHVEIEFGQFQIQASDDLTPLVQNEETYKGHTIAKSRLIMSDMKDKSYPATFLSCKFAFNQIKTVYSRSVAKIDDIISYIGGLMEIILGILAIFIGAYNQVKYQLSIGGSFFNYNNDGKKVKSKDLNLWTYTKLRIYDLISTFLCFQPKWKQTKQMIDTIQQTQKGMDVKRLFRKLDYLEKAIDHDIDREVLQSMAVMKPMNIGQIKDQRKIMSYYPTVIQSKEAATVEDAIASTPESFTYLKRPKSIFQSSFQNNKEIVNQNDPKLKQEINNSLINDLGLDKNISKSISEYPIIAQQAKNINLSLQLSRVQDKMTYALLDTPVEQRQQAIMKVPLLILHRMRMNAAQSQNGVVQIQEKNNQHGQEQQTIKKKSLGRRIKKQTKQFFTSFDLFSVQPILRTDQSPQKQTGFFGCINFLIICVFAYVFMNLVINMVSLDASQLTLSTYKKEDKRLKTMPNIMVAFRFAQNPITKKYGLNNIYEQFNFTYTQLKKYQDFGQKDKMVPCRPEMWKLLGQNYYEYFTGSSLDKAYCLREPLNFTGVIDNSPFFKISTTNRKCFMNQNILDLQSSNLIASYDCLRFLQYYWAVIAEYKHFPVWIYYLIPEVHPAESDPIAYHVKQIRIPVYKDKEQLFQSYFLGTRAITYNSILPFVQNMEEKNQFAFNHFIIADDKSAENRFTFIFRLSIMAEVRVHERKVSKIDDAISYVGGLFGFFVVFFAFFFESYNQYRYELSVGESSFNYDTDGNKFSQKKLNAFSYIKYTIFKWMDDIFCYTPNWQKTQKMHQTLEQVSEFLDADKLLRRLQFMQRAIWHFEDKKFLLILTLNQHENISQIQKKRRILQYYDVIIEQKPAASVQDAVNHRIKSFTYLHQVTRNMSFQTQGTMIQSNQTLNINEQKRKLNRKEQLKKSLMVYLKLSQEISGAVSEHPQIADQADEIQLSYEWDQIEEKIALAFLDLNQKEKDLIIMKMPIIILHRIRMKAQKIKLIGEFAYEKYESKDQPAVKISGGSKRSLKKDRFSLVISH